MSEEISKVAVVGSGYWGKNLVRNFHALGALAAICESDSTSRDAMCSQYPVPLATGSYTDILNSSDVNAVALATPAGMHGQMVREALEAGKDVYVEKPLCLSETEGHELVENGMVPERTCWPNK